MIVSDFEDGNQAFYLFSLLLLFLLWKNVHLRLHPSLAATVVVVVVCCVQAVGHVAKQLQNVNCQCFIRIEVVSTIIIIPQL